MHFAFVFIGMCVYVCLYLYLGRNGNFCTVLVRDGCNDAHDSVFVFTIVFVPVCIWAGGDTFARGGWDGGRPVMTCREAHDLHPGQCARVHRAFHICFPLFLFVFPEYYCVFRVFSV